MTKKRKLMALGAALSLVMSTTGCMKDSMLEGTLLEKAHLAIIDGQNRVVTQDTLGTTHEHKHYRDILSGTTFVDEQFKEDCTATDYYYKKNEIISDISQFMTAKEVNAASKGELTDDMIAEIVYRAIKPEEISEEEKAVETKEDVKTKTLEQ